MTSIAQLGIQIDSSSAKTAVTNLTQLTAAANDAETAAGANVSAWSKVGEEFEEVVQHTRAHVLALADASEGTRAFTGILAHLPVPMLAVVAVVGTLTAAYSAGAAEANSFAKALATSGGAAGISVAGLTDLSQQIGEITGNTGKAAAALAALVATGAVGKASIGEFATAAVEASEKVGVSLEEISKNFADLANNPTDSTLQLGRALGYLTPALLEQIQALRQQGSYTDAARVAQTAYSDSLQSQAQQLNDYSSLWERLSKAVGDYWDKVKSLGRVDLTSQLKNLQENILPFDSGDALAKARDEAEIARLQKLIADGNSQAEATQAKSQFADDTAHLRDLDLASLEAYATKSKALYESQTQDVVRAYQLQASGIQAQEDVLDAQRSAGLLDDQQYYDAKIKLIQQAGTAQEAEIDRQIAVAKKQAVSEATTRQVGIINAPDDLTRIRLQAEDDAATEASVQHIKDLQAQRAQVATKTSSDVTIANLQEGASTKALTQSLADLVASTEAYNASLQKTYQLTLDGIGAGDAARSYASQVAQFQAAAQAKLDSAQSAFRNSDGGAAAKLQLDATEQVIKDGLAKQLQDYDAYYKALQDKQSDWVNGAKDAFQNYIDQAQNVAGLTNTAFTNSFKDIEDSMVNFVTTGKFSFKDLANSILAELVRVEVKILESQVLQSVFGSFFGGGGPDVGAASAASGQAASDILSGALAGGGPVNANSTYLVGEKGPELFVPSQAGSIVPNGQYGGSGVTVVSNNNFGPGSQVAALTADLDRRDAQIKSDVYNSIARGRWNLALSSARS